jgi:hypothetical protein
VRTAFEAGASQSVACQRPSTMGGSTGSNFEIIGMGWRLKIQ